MVRTTPRYKPLMDLSAHDGYHGPPNGPKNELPKQNLTSGQKHSLKLTAKAPENRPIRKGNNRIPTIHFILGVLC